MFFNSRNGQGHFLRYFGHGLFVNPAEEEDAPALARQRIDDVLEMAKRVAGDEIRFGVAVRLEQLEIGDRLEADDLVAARIIDDQVTGDGEEESTTRADICPVFRRIGAGKNLRDHVFRFLGRRQDTPEAAPEGGLVRQNHRLEPIQLGAYPIHTGPLISV